MPYVEWSIQTLIFRHQKKPLDDYVDILMDGGTFIAAKVSYRI